MKIVINSCYGGFSLSPLAIKRIADLKGVPCFFFKSEFENGKSYHIPTSMEKASESLFFSAFNVPNPDEYMKTDKDWLEMTNEEKQAHNERWDKISHRNRYEDRTDKLLVSVVEELGDKANGSCAKLRVIEIPDNVEWQIEEYDGFEHIAEKHKTWS